MKKILVIYSSTEIILVSEFVPGTAIVTPYFFAVDLKGNLISMLTTLGIEDLSKLDEFKDINS